MNPNGEAKGLSENDVILEQTDFQVISEFQNKSCYRDDKSSFACFKCGESFGPRPVGQVSSSLRSPAGNDYTFHIKVGGYC